MIRYFRRVLTRIVGTQQNENPKKAESTAKTGISSSLNQNLKLFRDLLGPSEDFIVREASLGCQSLKGAFLYMDGLANTELLSLSVLKPLMYDTSYKLEIGKDCKLNFESLDPSFLSTSDITKSGIQEDLLHDLLSGSTVVLVEGASEALSINARQWDKRSVTEPQTENVVRGPRQGFTESLRSNTSMIRRIIKNPKLRLESVIIGEQTQTDIGIMYIDGIVKDGLVAEIKRRLSLIVTDSILDSGYIESFIQDSPYSIFETVGYTEKPDVASAKLLEGRAAIIVDGSPTVLTVPMVFIEDFQTSEDYYVRYYYGSYLRIIRLLAYFLTVFAPALYVAITTYHQEIIPTPLLFTITAGLVGRPFPALIEALVMVITFDILKEAGIRLPKPIGSAVSIVGALVIGNAAVNAGLVGPFMVIIIAITAISNFIIPKQFEAATIMRYALLLLAGFLGGFGIIVGVLALLVNIESLESFGVQYLSPITPFSREGMKDTFVRSLLRTMRLRPHFISGENKKRREFTMPDETNNKQ